MHWRALQCCQYLMQPWLQLCVLVCRCLPRLAELFIFPLLLTIDHALSPNNKHPCLLCITLVYVIMHTGFHKTSGQRSMQAWLSFLLRHSQNQGSGQAILSSESFVGGHVSILMQCCRISVQRTGISISWLGRISRHKAPSICKSAMPHQVLFTHRWPLTSSSATKIEPCLERAQVTKLSLSVTFLFQGQQINSMLVSTKCLLPCHII